MGTIRQSLQEECRKSLAEHDVVEKEIMLYDRIALARHDSTATQAERLQNAKKWFLRLNTDASKVSHTLAATQQSLSLPESMTTISRFEGGENFHLQCRSENKMAVQQRVTGQPVGDAFTSNIAVAKLAMADELELMVFHII